MASIDERSRSPGPKPSAARVKRPAAGQAVLADQPEPAAAGPGQFGGVLRTGGELAVQGLAEQPGRAVEVADEVLDQVEAGRRPGLGQVPRCGRVRFSVLLGDLNDDAVGTARMQERLFPARVVQLDPDRLDAEGPDPAQRGLDIADAEVEVVRAGAVSGQEAFQEGRVGAAGGGQQLNLRPRGVAQLTPPETGRVAAVDPRSAQDRAEQVPAVGQRGRADREVVENGGAGASSGHRDRTTLPPAARVASVACPSAVMTRSAAPRRTTWCSAGRRTDALPGTSHWPRPSPRMS